jgi:hypothetical protein
MQEVNIKNNPLGLEIVINGVPDIKLIPQDQLSVYIAALENQINKHFLENAKGKEKKSQCKNH